MIHKNLTPFFWGPRVTSRKPPQVEMAVCVRAVFQLAPGKPLVAIEDPIQQGFMRGDTFAPDDINQEGPLLHADDFAEWKPHADLLLQGTCHPPGASATKCDVRFTVGAWSKTLRVIGPRVFTPGLLLGGKLSEPQPFTHMALAWQNAYGGEGYLENPVGRGFAEVEMPTVEHPASPVTKKGKSGVVPATFLPISPHWAQRSGKRGKKYDATWKKTRAPFYAEDFDWTYFQSAPEDQRLDGYLRGDEDVAFENLHPGAPRWQTKLPGLRIRAFVKTLDGVVREPDMHLDTLYADLDDGKLYLTWRGLAPIRDIDMTDVGVVLIASEPLADEPKPFAAYEALLNEYEADPVGLKTAFPPGFMMVADAVAAAELAERNGDPMPDLKQVAANLPAGCPFPPWFLAAAAGDEDPLGIKAAFPPGMLDSDDPLGMKAKVGGLADPAKVQEALAELPNLAKDPSLAVKLLKAVAGLLPPDKGQMLAGSIESLEKDFAAVQSDQGGDLLVQAVTAQAAALAGGAAAAPMPAAASYAQTLQLANAGIEAGGTNAGPSMPAVDAAKAELPKLPTSLDDAVSKALEPLDAMELPEMPAIPDVEADLAVQTTKLQADEAKLRQQHGDHPMLGLFALGHRLISNAPRPGDVAPDLSPIGKGLGDAHKGLLAQGISAAALGPLSRLLTKVEALVAKVPKRTPPPAGEFAQQDLKGRDFSRRDLRGVVFAQSDLTKAKFVASDLTGADFRGANLTSVDFTGANLSGADLSRCTLTKAVLARALVVQANLIDADLGGADLTGANLQGVRAEQARMVKAKLPKARLVDADLRFADLSKCDLQDADLSGAHLSLATIDLAKADRADFSRVVFDMARLTKCRLRGARLRGARSSMGSLGGSDLTGADLRECQFEKVDFMKAVLDGADCSSASLKQAILRDVQAIGTDFRGAELAGASATGSSTFAKSCFTGASGKRSTWMDVDFSHAVFARSSFENAYFQGCKGEGVDFEAAILRGACFRRANLLRPRFAHADLCGADFNCASLDDANFRDANCYDAKFLGAKAVRSDFERAFVVGIQLDDPGVKKP